MRTVALNELKQGINRQKVKGGANPESLYDLLNGYVDLSGDIVSRPGTDDELLLPAGTKGLCSVNSGLVVFAHEPKTPMPAGVTCEVLPHPEDETLAILRIHFAQPFLGNATGNFLYVAVEYENGDVYHFWTRLAQDWAAETTYTLGEMVQPTVPNGYLYRANRLGPAELTWAPNVAREVGDKVEPTTFSGWEHTVTEVIGVNPRSGPTEPDWAEEDGGITIEDTGMTPPAPPVPGTTTPPTTDPDDDVTDRYGGFDSRSEQ